MPPESDIQFLARMIVSSREGQQIPSADARRLNNIATYGDSLDRGGAESSTTMPEERRPRASFPPPSGVNDLVRG